MLAWYHIVILVLMILMYVFFLGISIFLLVGLAFSDMRTTKDKKGENSNETKICA